jgi:hypothetical protein
MRSAATSCKKEKKKGVGGCKELDCKNKKKKRIWDFEAQVANNFLKKTAWPLAPALI